VAFLADRGAGESIGEALPVGGTPRVVAIDLDGTVIAAD
jgi:hypothetical protein